MGSKWDFTNKPPAQKIRLVWLSLEGNHILLLSFEIRSLCLCSLRKVYEILKTLSKQFVICLGSVYLLHESLHHNIKNEIKKDLAKTHRQKETLKVSATTESSLKKHTLQKQLQKKRQKAIKNLSVSYFFKSINSKQCIS